MPVGHVIDRRYTVRRLLGNGGMGAVYEAEHTHTGRSVAVKVLLSAVRDREASVGRFANEGKHGTRVVHKNVAAVLDMGVDQDSGDLYLVQELLCGKDLRAFLEERRVLTPSEAVAIVSPLLHALQFAHEQGVVHRDVKPDNVVLVTEEDGAQCPKLIDFGIAAAISNDAPTPRMTSTGAIVGTPSYMAPEQARSQRATPQVDVWAAGVMLYELIAGTVPYSDQSAAVVIARLLTETPPMISDRVPGISHALEEVIHRAIDPDCSRRYPTAQAFVMALEALPSEALALNHTMRRPQTTTADLLRDTQTPSTLSPASVSPLATLRPRGAAIGAALVLCVGVMVAGRLWPSSTASAAGVQPPVVASAMDASQNTLSKTEVPPTVTMRSDATTLVSESRPSAAAAVRPRTTLTTRVGIGARPRAARSILSPIDSYPGMRR